jgi:hypothetical protein
MAEPRKQPTLTIKLAATLLMLKDAGGEPLISHEHAKLMSAEQINSLFQFDHWPIRHEAGGPTEPWNLTPRMIPEHRTKTAKIDIPEAAKIKRIGPAEEAFRARMLAKSDPSVETAQPKRRQSRPFPKQSRPMRGRNDFQRRK